MAEEKKKSGGSDWGQSCRLDHLGPEFACGLDCSTPVVSFFLLLFTKKSDKEEDFNED